MSIIRRYTFKLYPNTAQRGALEEQSRMMAQLWNALLQRREDVYRRERRTLSNYEMKKEITTLRAECPEWQSISVAAARGVADHLDEAFKAFFKRAKRGDGASSGYPRYKRVADGMSISFSEKMGSGWSLKSAQEIAERSAMGRVTACRNGKSPRFKSVVAGIEVQTSSKPAVTETTDLTPTLSDAVQTSSELEMTKNWRVYVKGVPGMIKARGTFPAKPEEYRTGEIIKRDGVWHLSIVVRMQPRRSAGTERLKITFDLIDEFARVERAEGQSLARLKEQITAHSQHDDAGPGSGTADLGGDENSGCWLILPSSGSGTADLGGDENYRKGVSKFDTGSGTADLGGDENVTRLSTSSSEGSGTADLGGDENAYAVRPRSTCGSGTADLGGDENKAIMARIAALGERADFIQSEGDRRYRKFSWRWKRAKRQVAALQGRQARIRKHQLHLWSTSIVAIAGDLTVVRPAVKEQTASARGDERDWGANVKAVATLNRNTLNQAPAMVVQMLTYKAAEAGIRCDVIEDAAPKIAVGEKLVAAGKVLRKSKRALRNQYNERDQ